jgi:subtilase family protein
MKSSTRARVRTGILSVGTATALAAALAAPATAAQGSTAAATAGATTASTTATASSLSPRVVTLVTGDRVVVRQDEAGRLTASLTPRSPHYGKPVEFVNEGGHSWVVPKLPVSERKTLDTSVFDVASLSSGRVALDVTFQDGIAPRSLPGIDVRTSSARRSADGRTTVSASYDASRPLPARLSHSLAGVSRIAVAGANQQAAPAYALQTLTINGTNAKGNPLRFADVFVFNTDDGRLFAAFGGMIDGQWKVSVPAGNYLLLSSDFRHAVVSPATVVDTDTSASFSMADATVKPKMTLPDHKSISPSLDLLGTDASGNYSFDFGWIGFRPKVNPSPQLASGTLDTEVADLWAPKGYREFTFHHRHVQIHPLKDVAAAKEVESGIPHDLTFHYTKSDFANVAIKHYATGPKTGALDGWFGVSKADRFAFVELFPTVRPGVVHAMFQGSKDIRWDSMTTASRGFRTFTQVEQASTYQKGQRAAVPFFRGPVTPVVDRGDNSGRSSYRCSLCVHQGTLVGGLSMLAAAGTKQFGISDQGSWSLVSRRSQLDHGRYLITPFVKNITPGKELRLYASTDPATPKTKLSSKVHDYWQFKVPSADAVVPILRASYVPPTNLMSRGKAGKVSFPLTFDNLGPARSRVTDASLTWSVNGTKWHPADLKRKNAHAFRVSYTNPAATTAHKTLSLRVQGKDAAGRKLFEQVDNAYLLPRSGASRTVAPSAPRATTAAATSATGMTVHVNRFDPKKLCRTSMKSQYSCFVKLNAATKTAGKASPDPAGWGAPALRQAYGLGSDTAPSTVAVVVAFDYPHAEADMNRYRAQFGLPACTSASGCFKKINQKGEEGNYPEQDYGWGVEASLDLQMISTACPTCHIVLVESNIPTDKSLGKAEQAAVDAGATVTNHSFGRIELTGTDTQAALYDHPGVTAVASTGDFGYQPASFPASSPQVVAVGGTVLSRSSTGPRGWTEKAWQWAGSGCSAYFPKVVGQTDTACHMRTISDVSAVAKGLAIYNTSLPPRYKGWLEVDGTSASSPLISGMIGSVGRGGMRPSDLYAGSSSVFNDVTTGRNGFCNDNYICTGVAGYDGPTGLGTPKGADSFLP